MRSCAARWTSVRRPLFLCLPLSPAHPLLVGPGPQRCRSLWLGQNCVTPGLVRFPSDCSREGLAALCPQVGFLKLLHTLATFCDDIRMCHILRVMVALPAEGLSLSQRAKQQDRRLHEVRPPS